MQRNCDNCNFGSYNLNCNDGKETLFCKESEYEREVNPTDVCELHQFIEGMEFDNKHFLKRLTKEQIKILILLVLNEYEQENNTDFYSRLYNSLAQVSFEYIDDDYENKETVCIRTHIGKRIYSNPWFVINDYEIEMRTGNFVKKYNNILKQYFAQIFGREYIEFLYQKKLAELNEEKESLIRISEGPALIKKLPNLNN